MKNRRAKPTANDWANEVTSNDVRKMIERTFAFLVSVHSFHGPIDRSINTIVISLSYTGQNLSIEPYVDRKDCFVGTSIVRLEDGLRPEGWEVDANGYQFSQRLFEAALRRNVKVSNDNTPICSPKEKLQSLLDAEVAILQKGFSDFLADDAAHFEELNHERFAESVKQTEKEFFARAEELFRKRDFLALTTHMDNCDYEISKLWMARLEYAKNQT